MITNVLAFRAWALTLEGTEMELFHSVLRGRSDHPQPDVCPGSPQPVGMRQSWPRGGHHGWGLREILPLLQSHWNVLCAHAQPLPHTQLAGWGIFGKLRVPHALLIHPPIVVQGHRICLHPHPAEQLIWQDWFCLNQCSVYHFEIKYNHWRLPLMRSWPCVHPGGWIKFHVNV